MIAEIIGVISGGIGLAAVLILITEYCYRLPKSVLEQPNHPTEAGETMYAPKPEQTPEFLEAVNHLLDEWERLQESLKDEKANPIERFNSDLFIGADIGQHLNNSLAALEILAFLSLLPMCTVYPNRGGLIINLDGAWRLDEMPKHDHLEIKIEVENVPYEEGEQQTFITLKLK